MPESPRVIQSGRLSGDRPIYWAGKDGRPTTCVLSSIARQTDHTQYLTKSGKPVKKVHLRVGVMVEWSACCERCHVAKTDISKLAVRTWAQAHECANG